MDVLWLSHLVPYPPKSGALLRAYHLVRSVAARHRVDLVAFIQEPLLASFYPDLETALHDCQANLQPICRSVTFLPISKLKRPLGKQLTAAASLLTRDGYMARWLQTKAGIQTLRALTRVHAYDVAHFDHESLAVYRPILGNVPVTLGHHNAESHMLLRRAANEPSLLRRLYFRREGRKLAAFERRISQEFALHITCSELDSERLREVMPTARFKAIPNGVDVGYFTPREAPLRPNSAVFVASMNWYPNVDAVLFLLNDIWPLVRREVPAATLDIIGPNAPTTVVETARRDPSVTVHGYVPDIRPLVTSSAIYVCPVRDGGGTKLKVLDAFAMGKCMVAHPVACEGIDVTPGHDVLLAETADRIARKIVELFGDADLRAQIGARARALVEGRYSFDRIGAEFTGLLEGLVEGTP